MSSLLGGIGAAISGAITGNTAPVVGVYSDPEPSNWYQSFPYGFEFFSIDASKEESPTQVIYLPISPSNITTQTHFATNIVTTLYGIVEEHSEVRYYDITISGTTGFAPIYIGDDFDAITSRGLNPLPQRSSFDNFNISLGGLLPEVTNTINQAVSVASDIATTISGGNGNKTGIDPSNSGYVAFHNLYRFFLKYKQDAAGVTGSSNATATAAANAALSVIGQAPLSPAKRNIHPIRFLNYKDTIKYDCVPIGFTLTRSADSPMLYNYNIKIRAFNLRDIDGSDQPDALDLLAQLGLGDNTSTFGKILGGVKSIASSISTLL